MRYPIFIMSVGIWLMGFVPEVYAQVLPDEGHIKVAMRMIGNQLLLHAGDSNSRVLPVVQEGERYKIPFENAFSFDPEILISLADTVVAKTDLLPYYRIEVEECVGDTVVYSYEVHAQQNRALIPCRGRIMPKACYVLFFTPLPGLTEVVHQEQIVPVESTSENTAEFSLQLLALGMALVLFVFWLIYSKRKSRSVESFNVLQLGEYRFNKSSMELMHKDESVELSSKEADLLLLLYASANNTVERADILKSVWGDEGGYVGRTLDVFISKLRKKLEADSRIKIINVRGVGYKLII